uniref:Putative antigen 5 protein n=1 Tax=Ixodes ricinus TaxID=34613 RepID=A0A0K8RGN4_IXORI
MKSAGLILIAALLIFAVNAREPKLGKSKFKAKKGGIQEAFVNWHNHYRKRHRVPYLKYHSDLGAMAKNWANYIAYYNLYQHRPQSGRLTYGENIYWLTNVPEKYKISPKSVVTLWYDEIKLYDYNYPYFESSTAHFTQVVWKETQYVGCGWARSPQTKVLFVVCNYWRQGNMAGEFRANVLRRRY